MIVVHSDSSIWYTHSLATKVTHTVILKKKRDYANDNLNEDRFLAGKVPQAKISRSPSLCFLSSRTGLLCFKKGEETIGTFLTRQRLCD